MPLSMRNCCRRVILASWMGAFPLWNIEAQAFDFKTISDEVLHSYQQKNLQYEDPLGDAILCQKARNAPEILSEMKRKEFDYDRYPRADYVREAEEQMRLMDRGDFDADEIILGRESPYNIAGFEKMFLEVLRDEASRGLRIQAGHEHEWSQSLRKSHGGYCSVPFGFSKLLMALFMGQTSLHMATGFEDEYLKWVLKQPKASITPESAFRSSLRLTGGNVYLALLTIENLYSAAWTVRDREHLPWIQKVRVIVSAHQNATFDNFGPWYHFWGMVLYSYLRNPAWSRFVAHAENAGTLFIVKSDRRQKHHTNIAGAKVGSRLARIVKKELYRHSFPNPEALRFENYIQQDEDFRDRIRVKKSHEMGLRLVYRNSPSVGHKNGVAMTRTYLLVGTSVRLSSCRVDVIPDKGFGLDARHLKSFENVSFDVNESRRFTLSLNQKIRGVRVFIFQCQNSTEEYVQELNVKD